MANGHGGGGCAGWSLFPKKPPEVPPCPRGDGISSERGTVTRFEKLPLNLLLPWFSFAVPLRTLMPACGGPANFQDGY